jgi:hypothetical protein
MTHKLIKTDNYLLVGSDDNIKRGCFYCVRTKNIFQDEGEDVHCCNGDIRIIAHLPLNGSLILEGVDLLPPYSRHQEDGVEELAQEWYDKGELTSAYSFKAGYNKAREKYKYTEEDMRKAIDMATTSKHDSTLIFFNAEEIIQYLHQYPTEFECEMIPCNPIKYTTEDHLDVEPKTITTAQGIQWVGKYK